MKKLLIVCATGLVTSTVVHDEICNLLEMAKIQANIIQCKATDIPKNMEDVSLIVSTIQLKETYSVPIISALPLLTGREMQGVQGEIIQCMK